MTKKKRHRKKSDRNKPQNSVFGTQEHILDRLYLMIDTRKGHDPESSYTARLFTRGRAQIAKKLGEEAVEAVIEGTRGLPIASHWWRWARMPSCGRTRTSCAPCTCVTCWKAETATPARCVS